MAKGRMYEYVRAHWNWSGSCCLHSWKVVGLQDIFDLAFNWMPFHFHSSHVGPSTQLVMIYEQLWGFEVSWSPSFVLDPPLWGGLDAKSGREWKIINFKPCRTPCKYFVHLNSLGPLRLSSSSAKWSRMILDFTTKERFQISIVTGPQVLVQCASKHDATHSCWNLPSLLDLIVVYKLMRA